jgi:hypothetical protein
MKFIFENNKGVQEVILELTPDMEKVFLHAFPEDDLETDLKRRVNYIITHKYEAVLKELKEEWDSKLESHGITMIPTNKEEYARLVFKHPGYKSRSEREAGLK